MKRYLILAALAVAAVAPAQTAFWTGDTTGDPLWNRPASFTTLATAANGSATPYEVQPFFVSASGQYVFEAAGLRTGTAFTHTDTYILVYSGSFSSASPLANLIAGDDDYPTTSAFTLLSGNGAGFATSRIALGDATNYGGVGTGLGLTAGTQYFAVVTGFANVDLGTYEAAIGGGPGSVTLGTVPEPATMAALGIGAVALLRRRKKA